MNWRRAVKGISLLALIVGGGWVLATAYPTYRRFFPKCTLFEITGIYCPGCGSTRALRHLLCGNIAKAFSYNPLFVSCLPFFLWWGYRYYLKQSESVPFPAWMRSYAFNLTVAIVLVVYFVARNLPWWPFSLLAPPPTFD